MFSFYLNFNINILANSWFVINLAILLPPIQYSLFFGYLAND